MKTARISVIVLSILFSAALLFAAEEEFKKSYEFGAEGTVSVENVNGDVTVQGWNGTTIEMIATKYGNADNFDVVRIEVDSSPGNFRVKTRYPTGTNDTKVSVRYQLKIPSNSNLQAIKTVNGSVSIAAINGTVDAATVNGQVGIKDAKSSVKSATVNGEIEATFTELPTGSAIEMKSVNGGLVVALPAGASADFEAKTMNGDIHSDFPATAEKSWMSRRLEGRIGKGGSSVEMNTVNGSITIRQQ